MYKIAIDAMGGDFAPKINVLGAMQAVQQMNDVEIVLYGDEKQINKYLTNSERITVVHADKALSMGEHDPVKAVRSGEDYSMFKAMKACKEGECQGMVSAGPTQVVVVASHLIVKRIKQMQRVALAPIVPSIDGKGRIVLDSGANVELKPEHFVQIAYVGSLMAKHVLGFQNPTVGLANIGSEEGKGRLVDQEAYQLLKNDKRINFIGNVEPKEWPSMSCDVLVADGFTGNMIIKSTEGAIKLFSGILKQEIKKSFKAKIGYLFMKKSMNNFKKRFDTSEVGGAMICGVNVPIVKAHGNSDEKAIASSVRQVRTMIEKDIVGKIIAGLGEENE